MFMRNIEENIGWTFILTIHSPWRQFFIVYWSRAHWLWLIQAVALSEWVEMKNQIMERHKPRRHRSIYVAMSTAAKACAFIVFILSAENCRLSLVLLSVALSKTSSSILFPNPLFLISSLWLLLVIYFGFSVLQSDSRQDIIQFAVDFGLDFLLSSIIAGSFFFIPRVFSPFWPIVACKFLLPFPILLDWSSLLLLFFPFLFLFLPPLHITQRLSSLVVPAWRTVSIRAHRHSSSSSLSAIY